MRLTRPSGWSWFLALSLLFLLLPGCALKLPGSGTGSTPPPSTSSPAPPPSPVSAPAPQSTAIPIAPAPLPIPSDEQTGPAGKLYAEARMALDAGQPGQAEILLERALRIEPGNALYWHALGRAKYDMGDFAQAVQFCRKAESKLTGHPALARQNRELLESAYQKLGRSGQ